MPGCSPAKDEACLSDASHLVKEPEVLDEIRRLVELSVTDFRAVLQCLGKHRELVNLTIVLTHLPLIEVDASSTGIQTPRDAVGIDAMRLGESRCDARHAEAALRGPVLTRVPMPPLVSISTRMLWGSVPLIMATRSTPDSMA